MKKTTIAWPRLSMLSRASADELHHAATKALEETGVNIHHAGMRRKLIQAGARSGDESRVYLAKDMVEAAIRAAKNPVVVSNRDGKQAMPLGANDIYFGTGSDLIFTRDSDTGERRPSLLEDVSAAARLCDALDDIDFVMSFGLPQNIRSEELESRQFYAMLSSTVKPTIMTSVSGEESLARVHAMACATAGGDLAFRQSPNYLMYGQFISPLQHDRLAIERLIFCADHEVPLICVPTIMPGMSGPVTLSGSLILAAAESLAGLVMHQLQRPGAPYVFGACVGQLDMQTMLFRYGSVEWRLADLAMAELARSYGLAVFGTGGATDSKVLDAQTGFECAGSLLVAALAGVNLIHDVGYLESGLTGSLESILLGAECVRWVKHFVSGIQISSESLALEAIREVGPGRHFLGHEHTLKYLRSATWSPHVVDRAGYAPWAADGCKDYAARARDHVRRLLVEHQARPLGDSLDGELRRIANLSERRMDARGEV